ncbi:MAG: IclR family transcriptional regulator [Dehalococcoidia bacterium]|jgi:DNA-binding IclR family transcriptional regulator|nr:IclR family transcriptional regulator [Dehalococcoidia bacterium]MDW8008098.1 IclR family transcriptional regulator [Chloroflexota bacterium]
MRSLQTLDRGLLLLEVLAQEPNGLTVTELASRMAIHRTNVYRLLSTLAQHKLVRRDRDGRYFLGTGVVNLARGVAHDLRAVALPILAELAEKVESTAFLTLADGEEAVALAVVEPRRTNIHVAYRVGFRHPLDRGASGLAILAGRPPQPGEREEVKMARRLGYSVTHGEIQPGASGIAAPICVGGRPADASVGVVTIGELDVEAVAPHVLEAARAIAEALA